MVTLSKIAFNPAGDLFLAGTFTHSLSLDGTTLIGNYAAMVMKLNSEGNVLWHAQSSKETGAPGNPYSSVLNNMTVNSSGEVFITGTFQGKALFGSVTASATTNNEQFPAMLVAKIGDIGNNVSVEENELADSGRMSVCPNPTGSSFTLEYVKADGAARSFQITIMDILGSVVYEHPVDNFSGTYKETIDLKHLAKGAYFVTVKSSDAATTKKVVVQ